MFIRKMHLDTWNESSDEIHSFNQISKRLLLTDLVMDSHHGKTVERLNKWCAWHLPKSGDSVSVRPDAATLQPTIWGYYHKYIQKT
jgi:hypothetical protein